MNSTPGVAKCANPAKERSKVDLLLSVLSELPFDADAAQEAARIRATLESQGSMTGPYDVLLAGHAIAADLTLVTDNTGEFLRRVHGQGVGIRRFAARSGGTAYLLAVRSGARRTTAKGFTGRPTPGRQRTGSRIPPGRLRAHFRHG